jgi:hypothetical protein
MARRFSVSVMAWFRKPFGKQQETTQGFSRYCSMTIAVPRSNTVGERVVVPALFNFSSLPPTVPRPLRWHADPSSKTQIVNVLQDSRVRIKTERCTRNNLESCHAERLGGGYYLTAARTVTSSCDEIRLAYPIAPGVATTYSIRADSESNALGMVPCPANTSLRQCERNSSRPSPT